VSSEEGRREMRGFGAARQSGSFGRGALGLAVVAVTWALPVVVAVIGPLAVSATPASDYATVVGADSPIGWYTLDDAAGSSVAVNSGTAGSSENGSVVGGVSFAAGGLIASGGAAAFNGTTV
jgi:hypothetical protein